MPRSGHPTSLTIVLGAVLWSSLTGCGDPPASKYPTQQAYVQDTTLGPGDVFEVRVYQQPGMTNTYSASSEGTISFPLIGTVKVTGKTPAEVETEIRDRLADGYLVEPQVSVFVKEYKSKKISVYGQVRKPGVLSFAAGMTVVDAISAAGGFTAMARKNGVIVTRADNGSKRNYTVPVEKIGKGQAANFLVRPGDVVFVPERVF